MIVCICNSVSDGDIARAIDEGASTLKEVARRTRAGTCCGSCRESIRDALRSVAGADVHAAPDRSRIALPILAAFNS